MKMEGISYDRIYYMESGSRIICRNRSRGTIWEESRYIIMMKQQIRGKENEEVS